MKAVMQSTTRIRAEGFVIMMVAAGYLWEAQNVPSLYHMPGVPGPTAFPMILGVVFGFSGLWLLISPGSLVAAWREKTRPELEGDRKRPSPPASGLWQRLFENWHFYTMWAVVLSYLFLMPILGFPLATVLLLAGFFLLLEEKRWPWVIGLALSATILIYLGFAVGLKVRLPLGILAPLLK